MQTREKQLAMVFAGVVGVLGVWMVLKPWYFGPIEQEQLQLGLVQADLKKAEDEQMQLLQATRQLADWKARSLPPDPKRSSHQRADALNGQRLYQEWLTDLARHCGFSKMEVTPGIRRSIQDVYVTAQVRIKGEGTYRQLCQFLGLFEQAGLLHRIESCEIQSSNHRGDPALEINLLAEGVALQDAPQRDQLFPRTELASSLTTDAGKLIVKDAYGFPEGGRFSIRIGQERLTVSHANDNEWTVTRAKEGTKAVAHAAGTRIDLGLFNPLFADDTAPEDHPRLAMVSEQNIFTIPPPPPGVEKPYLDVPREQTVALGNQLEFNAKAEGFDKNLGSPKFQLGPDVPSGMKIDPARGLVTWRPEDEKWLGRHTVPLSVTRDGLPEPITRSVTVYVVERNEPPRIASIDPQTVYSGQALTFDVEATDENENQQLKYSLGEGAPSEATMNSETGRFSWTPPEVVTEETIEMEIIVTDNGSPPEQTSVRVPVAVKTDVARFTRFVGAVLDADVSEAWLYDRWNQRDLYVKKGEKLQVADISADLVKIESSALVFQRGDETWRLELGQDVRDMQAVESAKTARSQ